MFRFAAATSPDAVSCVIRDAAYDTAAAADSAEPNSDFSHAANTASPARSSTHDRAGCEAATGTKSADGRSDGNADREQRDHRQCAIGNRFLGPQQRDQNDDREE